MNRAIKVPGPDHPISIEANPQRVIVMLGGRTIADSTGTLTLREASYPPVHYFPRADVDMSSLERSTHQTHCPYKGDASYYSIKSATDSAGKRGGAAVANAVWTYEAPHAAVAEIKNYLAFYPDRVDSIETV